MTPGRYYDYTNAEVGSLTLELSVRFQVGPAVWFLEVDLEMEALAAEVRVRQGGGRAL